jgi:radical SAM superfamily enzyme YgiQ (UPF0313 family)
VRILFVISSPFALEPLGVMQLSSIARCAGHETSLAILTRGDLRRAVERLSPDVVAYSTASADIPALAQQDRRLRDWLQSSGRRVFRVMGGPHATYAPWVIKELELDAVCQGDGDQAFPELLRRIAQGGDIGSIPNIGVSRAGAVHKEIVHDLDALPFPDRTLYDTAVPYYRSCGVRSVMTGRGCPYACTYCFNHAYNELFEGCGPIARRRSVDNVIEELLWLKEKRPPLKYVRFGDDTFAHRVDAWLEEFCEKYPARVGVPFHCMMRSNTLSEDTARLLAGAGCRTISMAIESGVERVRNQILRRNLSDQEVIASYAVARKYGLRTYANTMVGIPGSTLEDDFRSLEFARSVGPSAAVFPICMPYRGTELWREAVARGDLDANTDPMAGIGTMSVLKCFTAAEKAVQVRMFHLGPLYCTVPDLARPLIRRLIRGPFPIWLASAVGRPYVLYLITRRVFREMTIPKTPGALFRIVVDRERRLG